MSILQPEPCPPSGGNSEVDVETLLLCDIVNGVVVGYALAVYRYSESTGAPVGPPTFVDPATGAPYTPQGTVQPCPGGAVTLSGSVEVSNDAGNPLPVSGTVAVSNFPASVEVSNDSGNPLPVSGTVAVSTLPEVEVKNDAGNPLAVSGTVGVNNFPASVEISNDAGNPIPVSGTVTVSNLSGTGLTDAELRATPVPVSGTVTITDGSGPVTVDGTVSVSNFPASVEVSNDVGNPLPVSGPATDAQLRATPLPISGTVTVTDGSGPLTVDGTVAVSNFPASVEVSNDVGNPLPVSGTLAVSNFPASTEISNDVGNPIPISGTVTVTDGSGPLTVDGTVAVSNFPASVEVSNDVGNPLPVSGTVAISTLPEVEIKNDSGNPIPVSGPATDAQLRATPLPISGTVTVTDGSGPLTVDGTVAVSNFPASVEVSNDVGNPLPVSGTVGVSNFPASVEISNDVGNAIPVSATALTDGSQVTAIATPGGKAYVTTAGTPTPLFPTTSGYGRLRITNEAHSQFYDPFDKPLDLVNLWNTPTQSGGAAVSQGVGGLTITSGTTAGAIGRLSSIPAFVGIVPGFMEIGYALQFLAAPPLNVARFWGVGTPPVSPTAAAPVYDGIGWLLDVDSKLYAMVYAAGVEVFRFDTSSKFALPSDGLYRRYNIQARTDRIFWYFGSQDVPIADASFKFSQTQQLPLMMQVVNGATPPAVSSQLVCTGVAVGDTSGLYSRIADSKFGWRGATVTQVGGLAVTSPQILDTGNSTTIGTGAATLFTGAWYRTRSAGVVRQLSVLASNVAAGLGGTFTFEYSEDGASATISETRVITDFATVRDFDLLNAGEFYRVKFIPSRALAAGELIFITTTERTGNDGAFVRLANQAQEEANAALPGTFAYLKAFDPITGKSVNVRANAAVTMTPAQTPLVNNGVYTSNWFDLSGYETLAVLIRTDVPSIANGIDVQYSIDGGATIISHAYRTMTASDAALGSKFCNVSVRARYVRLVYTNNGSTNQSIFFARLEAIASPLAPTDTLEGNLVSSSVASMVRNIPAGKDPIGGLYENITRTVTDGLARTGAHVGIVKHEVATPILALTSWKTGQATISSTSVAVNVIPSPTTGRKSFLVKALSSNSRVVFVGPTSGVTSGIGHELAAGESVVLECDETAGVWVIGSFASVQGLSYIEVIGT